MFVYPVARCTAISVLKSSAVFDDVVIVAAGTSDAVTVLLGAAKLCGDAALQEEVTAIIALTRPSQILLVSKG